MKGRLGGILAMAGMFAAMGGVDMPSLSTKRDRKDKRLIKPDIKNSGDIPKGSIIETVEFNTALKKIVG